MALASGKFKSIFLLYNLGKSRICVPLNITDHTKSMIYILK